LGLAARLGAIMILSTAAIGFTAHYFAHRAIVVQLDDRIASETQMLLDEVGEGGIPELTAAIRERDAARSVASLDYLLLDRSGRTLAGGLRPDTPPRPGHMERMSYNRGRKQAQATTTILPGGERLVVAADRQDIDEIDAAIIELFIGATVGMLILGIGASWALGALTRRRLNSIDRTARAIIAGDLRQRMPIDGSGSEFDRVAETLNQMLDRIGALLENLRQVSSDVAHDLRTPLTRLHNRLQDARITKSEPERIAAIDAAIGQAQELLQLFAALLRISEIEAGALRATFQEVRLGELIEGVVDTYRPDAEASRHELTLDLASAKLAIWGEPRLLRQLVANLLDNALRHTPTGTAINVSVSRLLQGAKLVVEDNGPGVSPDDAPRLFERFSRAERDRSTSGHGLGLALVAAIARMHGGEASIEPGLGFRITVALGSLAPAS
jgi:signal transduction histidine kinase